MCPTRRRCRIYAGFDRIEGSWFVGVTMTRMCCWPTARLQLTQPERQPFRRCSVHRNANGEETEGGVNTNFVLFNLREALEEIDQTVKSLETDPAYGEPAFSVAMMHLYHHVNTAWNARNSTVEQSQSCSDEAFQKWSRYPSDLKPLGVE